MVIFVVECQRLMKGAIMQHGFSLSLEKAQEECEELWRKFGGDRLDYWVQPYFVTGDTYVKFK